MMISLLLMLLLARRTRLPSTYRRPALARRHLLLVALRKICSRCLAMIILRGMVS